MMLGLVIHQRDRDLASKRVVVALVAWGLYSCSGICLAIHRLKMLHEMMQAGGHQKRGARCDGKIPIQLEREICKVMDQGGLQWRGVTEARLGRYDDIVRLFTGESGVMRLGT